jgi:hypothetical protein
MPPLLAGSGAQLELTPVAWYYSAKRLLHSFQDKRAQTPALPSGNDARLARASVGSASAFTPEYRYPVFSGEWNFGTGSRRPVKAHQRTTLRIINRSPLCEL